MGKQAELEPALMEHKMQLRSAAHDLKYILHSYNSWLFSMCVD